MKHSVRIKIMQAAVVVFVFVLLIWPSGLSRRPDINNRLLVTSLGIDVDKKTDGVKISAQIIVPQQGDTGTQKMICATGNTLSDAVDNMNIKTGKMIELGHCGLIILGKDLIEKEPVKTFNYLVSSGEVNPEITVVAPKEGSAEELLQKASTFSEIDSMGLSSFISYSHTGINMVSVSLLKFLNLTNSKSKTAYIPALQTESEDESGENSSQQESGGGSGGSSGGGSSGGSGGSSGGSSGGGSGGSSGGSGGEKAELDKSKSAYIFKEGKLIGEIGEEEFKGLNWLDKNVSQGFILLENFNIFGYEIEEMPLTMKSKNVSSSLSFEDDGRKIYKLKLGIKLEIEDRHYMNVLRYEKGYKSDKIYEELSKLVEEHIKKQVESCRKKSIELDCDILGFNNKVYQTSPEKYELYSNQEEIFKNVDIEYNFKIEIV